MPNPVRLHDLDENGDYTITAYDEEGREATILVPKMIFEEWTQENRDHTPIGLNLVTGGHYL